jgi:hypothetical protein
LRAVDAIFRRVFGPDSQAGSEAAATSTGADNANNSH